MHTAAPVPHSLRTMSAHRGLMPNTTFPQPEPGDSQTPPEKLRLECVASSSWGRVIGLSDQWPSRALLPLRCRLAHSWFTPPAQIGCTKTRPRHLSPTGNLVAGSRSSVSNPALVAP